MPAEDSLGAYYPSAYEPFESAIRLEPSRFRRWDRHYGMIKRRRVIERYVSAGSILDIGCATGNFLAEMKQTGRWTCNGIEPDPRAAEYATRLHELTVYVGMVRDIPLPTEAYDVITLWNVLEHLASPITELKRLVAALKPGGIIVFSLPNLESYEVRLFGQRWFCWELPRHVCFFPATLVRRITNDLGLTLQESTCVSGAQVAFNLSLKYLYSDRAMSPTWHRVVSKVFLSKAGRVLFSPVFYLIGALRQGMIVTYVARKNVSDKPS